MKRKKTGGFTLIEVMIVVAIVAVLAAIAYPSYQDQVRKSRRAEGKGLLLDTAQALERCKTLYGVYNNENCSILGVIDGGQTLESGEGYYAVSVATLAAQAYQLQAVPQFQDPDCGTLLINQNGDQCIDTGTGAECLSTGDTDAADCW